MLKEGGEGKKGWEEEGMDVVCDKGESTDK